MKRPITMILLCALAVSSAVAVQVASAASESKDTQCWDVYNLRGTWLVRTIAPAGLSTGDCTPGVGCYYDYRASDGKRTTVGRSARHGTEVGVRSERHDADDDCCTDDDCSAPTTTAAPTTAAPTTAAPTTAAPTTTLRTGVLTTSAVCEPGAVVLWGHRDAVGDDAIGCCPQCAGRPRGLQLGGEQGLPDLVGQPVICCGSVEDLVGDMDPSFISPGWYVHPEGGRVRRRLEPIRRLE